MLEEIIMTLEEMNDKLKKSIRTDRYIHSVNVMNSALSLAGLYGVDKNKAAVAGLLHDCAKDLKNEDTYEINKKFDIETDEITKRQPELLHGHVGAYIAKICYGITDKEILNAIKFHTTGKENMNMLEKIIFISDYIEPRRNFPGVYDIREWVTKDIDRAIVLALDSTIKRVLGKGALLHPATVNARNYLIR
jgi:predicted HD superfamily hydrolase involved in NAD metabolism